MGTVAKVMNDWYAYGFYAVYGPFVSERLAWVALSENEGRR